MGIGKLYKDEEIESMNYMFGKSKDNMHFTEFELELASQINLFNKKLVELCKKIYENDYREVNI